MGKSKGRRIGKRRMMQRRRRRIYIGLIFACVVLVLGVLNFILYKSVSKYPKEVIAGNLYIGNVDVSGMTKEEALEALEAQLQADGSLTAAVKVGEETAEATLEEYGISYKDADKVVNTAVNYGKKGSLWDRYWKLKKLKKNKVVLGAELVLDKEAGETILTERAVPLAKHAKNASIKRGAAGIEIEPEEEGQTVNIQKSLKNFEEYINDDWNHKAFSIDAVVEKESPTVTTEDLESIQDMLGRFSTPAGEGERVQNLITGASKIDGLILAPGEEVSVCDRMVPFNAENGYVLGGSYEEGRVVESYGGGICQVSTTLYNAVLYAELEVVERYPHSMTVSYVKPSRDAAIAEGILDFRFRNNYDTPIYIYCEIDETNELVCEIYGKETREEGRTVEYESETLSTEEAGITYKANDELPLGTIQNASGAYDGVEAQLWKIVYQDGEEVSREVINHSSYTKVDAVVEVGTQSDDADAVSKVLAAIATQDESTIYAAVGQ